jgi:hypothetical protein
MTWRVNTMPKDFVELYNLSEGGGPIIRCYPNGNIRLFEIPQYGGEETDHGFFFTVNAAMDFCKDWN